LALRSKLPGINPQRLNYWDTAAPCGRLATNIRIIEIKLTAAKIANAMV
jgi:hypothetical protein